MVLPLTHRLVPLFLSRLRSAELHASDFRLLHTVSGLVSPVGFSLWLLFHLTVLCFLRSLTPLSMLLLPNCRRG